MLDENEMLMRKKVQFFYDSKEAVHVSYKKGYWKNGYIKEISYDFFIIDDFMDGDIPVFYLELNDISIYTPDKKRVENVKS
jgi:hypothetical protein